MNQENSKCIFVVMILHILQLLSCFFVEIYQFLDSCSLQSNVKSTQKKNSEIMRLKFLSIENHFLFLHLYKYIPISLPNYTKK